MTTTRAAIVTAVAAAAVYLAIPNAANALSFVGPTSHLWQCSQSDTRNCWYFDYSAFAEITSVDHERGSFRVEIRGGAYAPICCSTTPGDRYAYLHSIFLLFEAIQADLQLELVETRGLDNASYLVDSDALQVLNPFAPAENVNWYLSYDVTLLDPSAHYVLQFGVGHLYGQVGGGPPVGGGTVITPGWGFTVIVPEPSTAVMLGASILGLAASRRFRAH